MQSLNITACGTVGPPFSEACYPDYPSQKCRNPGCDVYTAYNALKSNDISYTFSTNSSMNTSQFFRAVGATCDFAVVTYQRQDPRFTHRVLHTSLTNELKPVFFYDKDLNFSGVNLLASVLDVQTLVLSGLANLVSLGTLALSHRLGLKKAKFVINGFMGIWLAVILGVFGNLLAIKLAAGPSEPIDPFGDICLMARFLKSHKNSKLFTQEQGVWEEFIAPILRSETPCARNLQLAFRLNPPYFLQSDTTLNDELVEFKKASQNFAFPILVEYSIRSAEILEVLRNSHRHFHVSDIRSNSYVYSYSPQLSLFTRRRIESAFTGYAGAIYEHCRVRSIQRPAKRLKADGDSYAVLLGQSRHPNHSGQSKSLNIFHLYQAFLLLLLGAAIGATSSLIEVSAHSLSRLRNRKINVTAQPQLFWECVLCKYRSVATTMLKTTARGFPKTLCLECAKNVAESLSAYEKPISKSDLPNPLEDPNPVDVSNTTRKETWGNTVRATPIATKGGSGDCQSVQVQTTVLSALYFTN